MSAAERHCWNCGGDAGDNWFDRSICPPPCDSMHTRCVKCGVALDHCPFDVAPDASSGLSSEASGEGNGPDSGAAPSDVARCQCGHLREAHGGGFECFDTGPGGAACPCEEFTGARSAAARRGFFCVPDESGGIADTPWVFCAACARTVAAIERGGAWWCSGCGDRLAFRPVVDRDPGDEQPESA